MSDTTSGVLNVDGMPPSTTILDPAGAAQHSARGWEQFFADRYEEALATFEQALSLDPTLADAHNGVGRVYERLGTPDAALAAYNRALALDPHYVPAYWGLGIVYYMLLDQCGKAVEVFRRGLELNPHEVEFYGGLGQAYARQGSSAEAISAFERHARLAPTDPSGNCNLGMLYLHLWQYEAAIAALQRAIAVPPSTPGSTVCWGSRMTGWEMAKRRSRRWNAPQRSIPRITRRGQAWRAPTVPSAAQMQRQSRRRLGARWRRTPTSMAAPAWRRCLGMRMPRSNYSRSHWQKWAS
ncbi:MAG TPA: tetratricopeptide repeat protein [Roseiflexaceae bacterium]|nr:tetratricopeptide repeat protein [Roseiflexaceae bacterium]